MKPKPTGVKTHGVGQRTTAHLNLTKTMADVIDDRRDVLFLIADTRANNK